MGRREAKPPTPIYIQCSSACPFRTVRLCVSAHRGGRHCPPFIPGRRARPQMPAQHGAIVDPRFPYSSIVYRETEQAEVDSGETW